ncbi:GspE/PulE family protein [Sphingobium sp. CAP-1]|uniref:GspE/PulE family protein n=1 Tax=Sphingobium sp. CAP-1 TaxID=2676077 RepID=UPI001E4DCD00|nr:ATPase, T2SS/T4P/T4SS family [Sphingobium sp. CAP-1]
MVDRLVAGGVLSRELGNRALQVQQETGDRIETVVTRLGMVSEQRLARFFSSATGIPIMLPQQFPDEPLGLGIVAPRFLRDQHVLPIEEEEGRLLLAVANPLDPFARDALSFLMGAPVRLAIGMTSDIDAALDRLYGQVEQTPDGEEAMDEEDLERFKDQASDAPVIRAVNRMISRAGEMQASDIHLEPMEDGLAVRFRIDGVMREMAPLPGSMKQAMIARIKVMASLNIAERRLPQDGRLRLAVRGHEIDLRVATSPTIHGESVVMRLLDRSNVALDFHALGFTDPQTEAVLRAVGKPHGIMLVTGPTGSGKTTSLYAALDQINTPGRKILTVEDPIEYRLKGVSQTQVQPGIGLTFASALRSFLRQDPDVIMVGEIRDLETAQIAVQAALTGHSILSTLHTNSAAAAVTRLLDMGMEPFLLTSTLNAVLAQRLVRRLCQHCHAPMPHAHDQLAAAGFGAELDALPADADFRRPTGCDECGQSGYRGRSAVVELLEISEPIADLIIRRAEARDIQRQAEAEGMRSMLADGLAKAARGVTTVEEVLRVTRES